MTGAVTLTQDILLAGVALAMSLAGIRLLRGPTQSDRVMALDVMVIAAVAAVALLAWRMQVIALLDVAVAVAIVFLFITIPVGAQLIARAALKNGAEPDARTRVDVDGECEDC